MQACVLSPLFSISATLFFLSFPLSLLLLSCSSFFSLLSFLWCCDVRAYRAQKNCFLALFYSNVPKLLQISLRSFSKKSAILSWTKKWKCNFGGKKKKKKRKYAHPSNKRSPLSFSETLLELSLHAKSSPYTVIYVDTAFLVIGSICDKKSFELLSRISEDWRYREMLCFKRACVWACLFFSRGILTSYSCSDGKEIYKRTWCTCKVVVFLIKKKLLLFCHSRCRRGRRIRFLKLTRLEGWSAMAGKLFSIKPILGYHIVHMTAFAAWSSGGVKVRSLLFHVFFF